ncbi:hypothetical protein R3X27_15900 [Tropicimonas sp. TH_r6]|uniref:hypothetical protein n=1 Tax=Tropicimonas sp. TH_r6 TaxID=3082085 RepID=UPI0029539D95|nr:hypothetical protein [Tropicimonas sp. TH_r6]MDV7144170.1 hypothetical protein [Tropicimonas sp. TH_r6]
MVKKKTVALDGLLDTEAKPADTGIPQRGASTQKRKPKPERRSDQISVRMKPNTCDTIETLAEAEGGPIAEIVEPAILAYAQEK